MFYRIAEVSRVAASRELYLLVEFWVTRAAHDAGNPPRLTNDFYFSGLRPQHRDLVTNAAGDWQRTDGVWVDMDALYEAVLTVQTDAQRDAAIAAVEAQEAYGFRRRLVATDVRGHILHEIEAYWRRAVQQRLTGDHTPDSARPLYRDGVLVRQRAKQRRPLRDLSDPDGLLAMPEVQAMRLATAEVL